jgi:hypothetical protein
MKMKKQTMKTRAPHWQGAMAAIPASSSSIVDQTVYRADAQSIHCNIVPRFPAERARVRHTRIESFKSPAVGCFGEPGANP